MRCAATSIASPILTSLSLSARLVVCSSAFHGLGTVRNPPGLQAALAEPWRSQRDIRQNRDAKHIARNRRPSDTETCLTFGVCLRCAKPRLSIPHLRCRRCSGLDGLRPILTRGYQHRFTNYVRRVRPYRIGYAAQFARPSMFRPYPSGNHGSFRAALRRRRLCADPFGVMQPPSRPPAKAGITPIPSVCTASSRNHICICRHAFGLSACHSRASEIPLYAFPRRSPSSAGRIVKEQILASRCHPLSWGRPSSVGVRATSDERNANG